MARFSNILLIVPFLALQACQGKFELSDVPNETTPATLAPTLPTLSINDISANESAGTLTFTVTLSALSTTDVSVDYATAPGSASAGGTDYTAVSGTLTIPAGSTTGTINVTINNDSLDEADESFSLNLANPVGATLLDPFGIGSIVDDDASPTLSINDVTAGEAAGTLSFTLTLSAVSGRDVTVNYSASGGTATGGGTDYTLAAGTATILAGATTSNIVVNINDDNLDEANETFNVVLASPVAASIADATGVGTITDNDAAPTLSINDMTLSEGAGTMSFTVTLSAVSGQDVTVDYAASGGTATGAGVDYSLIGGTLTILAGSTTGSIVTTIVDDALSEASETFNVVLSNPTNSTISDATGVGTITDNESMPTLSINDVTASESAGTLTFTVTLSAASGQNVTVDYAASGGTATSGGTDYTLVAGTATITAGTTTTSILVTLNNDSLDEADETFNVTLSNPALATISDATGVGTITDDDNPPTVTFAADQNISEPVNSSGNSSVTVSVSLSTASGYTVTVPYTVTGTATGGGTDHNLADGNITVTAGATSGSVSFDLTDDALVEGSETVIVTMGSPTNATQGAKTSQTITISDNDVTLGAFSISGITGASDAVQDAYLNGGLTPIVTWSASSNATDYDVTIYENDGTTVKCSLQNTANTSYDFSSCSLTAGSSYNAHVTAKAFGASDVNASNSLFTFSVNRSPTITTSGPWYVLSGGSIIIDAQYAVAPAVGTAQDADGDTLTFSTVGSTNSGVGTVTNNSTSITYSPGVFTGSETFSFTISDGKEGTVTGTMTVRVVTAFTWTGGGGNANWSTAANWCGAINTNKTACTNAGAAPSSTGTATHIAIFDDTCQSNCSVTVNANASMYALKMNSGYLGTVTQGTGFTMAVGAGGWTQAAGTFVGGTANISVSSNFSVTGGSFTSTSANLSFTGTGTSTITSPGTFTHNSGTVVLQGSSATRTLSAAGVDFNNLSITGWNDSTILSTDINVRGTLILGDTYGATSLGGGNTLNAYGNVTATSHGKTGTAKIKIIGSSNQTITGSGGGSNYIPHLEVASTGGTVTFAGNICIRGNFIYTSGTTDFGTSTIAFCGGSTTSRTITAGGVNFNNLTISAWNDTITLTAPVDVYGTLSLSDTYTSTAINGHSINAYGNVALSSYGKSGTTSIKIVGSGNQTVSATGASAHISNLEIDSSGGTVFFSGTINVVNGFTYTAGNVDFGTSTIVFTTGSYGTPTLAASGLNFYNLRLAGFGGTITLTSNFNVLGTLTLANTYSSHALNGSTISAYGDVVVSNSGYVGTTLLRFVGNTDTTLTCGNGSFPGTEVTFAKTAGSKVSLTANCSLSPAGQDVVIETGELNMAGFNLTSPDYLTINAGATLTSGGGTYSPSSGVKFSCLGTCN